MKRKLAILLISLLALIALMPLMKTDSLAAVSATGISLPAEKPVILGKTLQLTATLTPSNATSKVTWKSWDTSILQVDANGLVKGLKTGAAYVTASANGKSAKCLIRVVEKTGLVLKNGKYYYYSPVNGALLKGFRILSGKRYYFDPTTGAMRTGLIKVPSNGYTYHFLSAGDVSKGLTKVGGKTYYFDTNGVMKTGFQTVGGKRYFFDPATGEMQSGLIKTNYGYTYFFLPDGDVFKGGMKQIDGKYYYFSPSSGVMQTGLVNVSLSSGTYTYCFLPEGGVATGIYTYNGKTYYFGTNGAMQKPGMITIDGKKYYFDKVTGVQKTGMVSVGTTSGPCTYYFLAGGDVLKGFRTLSGKLYYFHPDTGVLQKSPSFRKIDGKFYYLDAATGEVITGVRDVDTGHAYFFDPTTPNGFRYGLQEYGGATYLIDNATAYVLNHFQTVDGKLYYFDETTYQMQTDTSWSYGGLNFQAGSDGTVTPSLPSAASDRSRILYWALTHLGLPYNVSTGYVCSTFAAGAYDYAGYTFFNGRSSCNQAKYALTNGTVYSSPEELTPGDVIFWNKESGSCDAKGPGGTCSYIFTHGGTQYHVHHIAIYLGNNQVIEAYESKNTTLVQNIAPGNDNYYIAACVSMLP